MFELISEAIIEATSGSEPHADIGTSYPGLCVGNCVLCAEAQES